MADEKTPLGTELREARNERGLSTTQLGEELRMNRAMLSMIESGEEIPSKETAGRIRGWIDSGRGVRSKAPRGPISKTYGEEGVQRQKRSTIG